MALLLPTLTGGLIGAMNQPSDQGAVKAQQWAMAYNTYALTATAGVMLPVFVGIEVQALAAQLASVMTNPNGTAAQFANAFATGIEAFWLLPPVPFAAVPIPAGAVTSFPGKPVLIADLISIFSSTTDQTAKVAIDIATALDTATRTVIVTFAPPPGSTINLA